HLSAPITRCVATIWWISIWLAGPPNMVLSGSMLQPFAEHPWTTGWLTPSKPPRALSHPSTADASALVGRRDGTALGTTNRLRGSSSWGSVLAVFSFMGTCYSMNRGAYRLAMRPATTTLVLPTNRWCAVQQGATQS